MCERVLNEKERDSVGRGVASYTTLLPRQMDCLARS